MLKLANKSLILKQFVRNACMKHPNEAVIFRQVSTFKFSLLTKRNTPLYTYYAMLGIVLVDSHEEFLEH